MSNWLEKHRGAEIEVQYLTDNNMYSDRGELIDFGDGWIELLKDAGKRSAITFVIPASAVRILKIHAPAPEPANVLLRPSSTTGQIEDTSNAHIEA